MPRPSYFLLSIAINEYAEGMRNLAGCLNDADDFKSCLDEILGRTLPSAVRSLTNSGATRSAIITTFYEHLIHNPNILPGDTIIIYYAGHGSQAPAPAEWHVPGGMVESLCPADQGVMCPQGGGRVPGIPDVTLNALFSILAREKGTNITFVCDSCHSGGVDRDLGNSFNFIRRGSTVELRDKTDSEILRQANNEALKFGLRGNYSSHVLLAACAAEENAIEDRSGTPRGVFTRALTHELRGLGDGIAFTTYFSLIASLKLYGQRPQCEGRPANCFLFSGRDKFGPCVFPLTRDDDGNFTVRVGHAHGVVEGTEMTVYWEASALRRLGVLVVQCAETFSSKLCRRSGEYFDVPKEAWAGIHRWPNTTALTIYTDFPLDVQTNGLESAYPLTVTQDESDAHSLRLVRSGPAQIEMESHDVLLAPHSKHTLSLGDTRLCLILSKIAHFHYHLRRHKSGTDLLAEGKLAVLRLYRLKDGNNGMYLASTRDLFKNNVAHLEGTDTTDSTAGYGIEIHNKSSFNLYAYLFAFNPFDYSIETLFMPPVGLNVSPPLKSHQSIKIGYNGGGPPLSLARRDTSDTAPLLLKLIVCTENVGMHHMEQSPALGLSPEPAASADSRYTTLDSFNNRVFLQRQSGIMWETSLAAIKVSAAATKSGFMKTLRSGIHF
ncbi:caspase domain-containing protein [Mycena olivaceomarginata]|nr:caspase domain-containing protein [Mycena olivaceomarginata]